MGKRPDENAMNLIDAFLTATAFVYLVAALYAFLGRPSLVGMQASRQALVFVGLFCLFVLSDRIPLLNFPMGIIYCVSTGSSFIGWPQVWFSYWKVDSEMEGSGAQQVGMAAWDLLLAVAFFMKA